MRHRCWGSGFPEDRLGSFREARVALSAGGVYRRCLLAGSGDCVLHEGRDLLSAHATDSR